MWFYAFLPLIFAGLGGVWTILMPPSPKVVGAVQHFAAGVVFYAAAGEVLPDVLEQGAAWSAVVGGGAGVIVMLLMRRATAGVEGPAGLVAVAGLDGVIDGLVLGLGFNAGQQQGILLAVALAVEFLFLALSIAGAFGRSASRLLVVGAPLGMGLAVIPGVLIAQPIGGLPESWQAAAFAFGLVALLYLVVEELLTEAHKRPQTAWGAAMFFVGFLALEVVGRAMSG
jgi:ZIP family zinc transporter